jgi:hypothetical protein
MKESQPNCINSTPAKSSEDEIDYDNNDLLNGHRHDVTKQRHTKVSVVPHTGSCPKEGKITPHYKGERFDPCRGDIQDVAAKDQPAERDNEDNERNGGGENTQPLDTGEHGFAPIYQGFPTAHFCLVVFSWSGCKAARINCDTGRLDLKRGFILRRGSC